MITIGESSSDFNIALLSEANKIITTMAEATKMGESFPKRCYEESGTNGNDSNKKARLGDNDPYSSNNPTSTNPTSHPVRKPPTILNNAKAGSSRWGGDMLRLWSQGSPRRPMNHPDFNRDPNVCWLASDSGKRWASMKNNKDSGKPFRVLPVGLRLLNGKVTKLTNKGISNTDVEISLLNVTARVDTTDKISAEDQRSSYSDTMRLLLHLLMMMTAMKVH